MRIYPKTITRRIIKAGIAAIAHLTINAIIEPKDI
jgi:hypothetical protein